MTNVWIGIEGVFSDLYQLKTLIRIRSLKGMEAIEFKDFIKNTWGQKRYRLLLIRYGAFTDEKLIRHRDQLEADLQLMLDRFYISI